MTSPYNPQTYSQGGPQGNPPGGLGSPGGPGGPQAYAAAPPPTRLAPNPLGLASLVVGAIGPLLGALFLIIQAVSLGSGGTDAFQVIGSIGNVLSGLVAVAALVLGLVAITRRGRSKTLAAAGIALGASGLVGVLSVLLYGAVLSLVY
ncbi:hypothetical protein [Herbiconiux sp. YIM B11900]|uniref:hypothetical protein n=1 Tax=Herbiconiux sp. YIM B11900 TaxID=3404131 RepID=UPI003F85FAA6